MGVSVGKIFYIDDIGIAITRFLEVATPALAAPFQGLFWSLVPLAINSMAQPGGRVCGYSSRYRTYLRCSPLLCAADSLSVMVRLLTNRFSLKLSAWESLGLLLRQRFDESKVQGPRNSDANVGERNGQETESIQNLEKTIWLRWLWFIFGTIPPTVQLLSMTGIPWTQTWAVMFLTSWAINEAIIIFASMKQPVIASPAGPVWPGHMPATISPDSAKAERVLSFFDNSLGATALVFHTIILNSEFRTLWREMVAISYSSSASAKTTKLDYLDWGDLLGSSGYHGSGGYLRPDTGPVLMWWIYVIIIFPTVIAIVFSLHFARFNPLSAGKLRYLAWPLFALLLMLVQVAGNSLSYGSPPGGRTWSAAYVCVISIIVINPLLSLLGFLGARFGALGENLLVLYPDDSAGEMKVDYKACFSLAFLLVTITASALYYQRIL